MNATDAFAIFQLTLIAQDGKTKTVMQFASREQWAVMVLLAMSEAASNDGLEHASTSLLKRYHTDWERASSASTRLRLSYPTYVAMCAELKVKPIKYACKSMVVDNFTGELNRDFLDEIEEKIEADPPVTAVPETKKEKKPKRAKKPKKPKKAASPAPDEASEEDGAESE